ncbi:MAG: response regulator transcription factor [Candidatus Bipolaricaulota bacterium]
MRDGARFAADGDAPRVAIAFLDALPLLPSEVEKDGFLVTTLNPGEARERIVEWRPDLVLLGLGAPGQMDEAQALLLWLLTRPERPAVVALTWLNRAADRVQALDDGADDIVPASCPAEEVRARIRAVLRRSKPGLSGLRLVIDDERKEVRIGGRRVTLSPKEYALLSLLASSPGRVFSSREIVNCLWPGSKRRTYATEQDAQKYIYLLRRKIEADASNPMIVVTVRGFGYRLAL